MRKPTEHKQIEHKAGASGDAAVRQRILAAAFAAFMDKGYAGTSTLEIATRAQVSKATLYALVGNKRQMLAACIGERASRFAVPSELPQPVDAESLSRALAELGERLLREMSAPTVLAVFRLAICEAERAPEVAQVLQTTGGKTGRTALGAILSGAAGLLNGPPDKMAEQFSGLLWGNLMIGLLLGVVDRPGPREMARRARDAAASFLELNLRR